MSCLRIDTSYKPVRCFVRETKHAAGRRNLLSAHVYGEVPIFQGLFVNLYTKYLYTSMVRLAGGPRETSEVTIVSGFPRHLALQLESCVNGLLLYVNVYVQCTMIYVGRYAIGRWAIVRVGVGRRGWGGGCEWSPLSQPVLPPRAMVDSNRSERPTRPSSCCMDSSTDLR